MNLNSLTDEELALRYVAGNNRAFDELLRRNQSQLFTYILFVVRDRHVADDVFQETFVRAISKLQNNAYRANGKFGAWLTRIAHNVMIDLFRSQKHKNIISIEDDTLTQLSARALLANNIEAECINAQVLTDVNRRADQCKHQHEFRTFALCHPQFAKDGTNIQHLFATCLTFEST